MNAPVSVPVKTRPVPPSDLFLCTLLTRVDADGDAGQYDVVIYFEVESYSPGRPASLWGPAPYPEEYPEWEFSFLCAEFDGGEPDDAPRPLTETEIATLKTWFEANHDRACEVAVEHARDDEADRADYLYDRYRDEQMERNWR